MALVRCRTGFAKGDDLVFAGDVFDDSHDYVTSTPADWWEPLAVRGAVEEATAVPGKKRTTRTKAEEADS